MNIRGIQVSNSLMMGLHKEILSVFSKYYDIEIKTLTVFQLYGFGNYNEDKPNLKGFISEISGKWINGKYLYNKIKEIEKEPTKNIKLRRDYLSLLIVAAGYDNYSDYIKNSTYLSENTRKKEGENFEEDTNDIDALYYVGYYVEDRQYYIKSKFTIYKMKTASWEILYWEKNDDPTFYTYFGKCVPIGETALSFYFSKENSNLNKECFINLFFGNKMKVKPILLGAYNGFGRNNNPVIGKLVFERVDNAVIQNEKVKNKEVNPIFHHYLFSQRLEVDGILPHKDSDLSVSINRHEIINFLIGSYQGFYLDENNYLIPVYFDVLNELGELKLKISNKNFRGIGRVNRTENYLISEFAEKNNTYSQFSLLIKPQEKDLFLSYMLIYTGAEALCGKVLLWKNNDKLKENLDNFNGFYLNIGELEAPIKNKVNAYLSSN